MSAHRAVLRGFVILVLSWIAAGCASVRPAHPPVIPYWALKPGIWEDNHNNEMYLRKVLVPAYRARDIPVGFVLIDSPWSETYNDFRIDRTRYPTFEEMVKRFRDSGISTIVWLTGTINLRGHDSTKKRHPDYDMVLEKGWYVKPEGQESPINRWWKGPGLYLDFTNPDAKAYFYRLMDRVTQTGIRGFKADQQDVVTNGYDFLATGDGRRITSTQYRNTYYRAIHDYPASRGQDDFMIMARPYSHQFDKKGDEGDVAPKDAVTMGWAGDFSGAFAERAQGLQLQQRLLYRSAQEGYGGLVVEIGGYYKARPDKESLLRGAQFAAFMPGWLNGGRNGGDAQHLPWFYDQKTVDIYRRFAVLKTELAPYVFSLSVDANHTGQPIVRDADFQGSSHELGPDIFVRIINAPLSQLGGGVAVALPGKGRWRDLWRMEDALDGGTRLQNVGVSLDRLPAYAREGALIPLAVSAQDQVLGEAACAGRVGILVVPGARSARVFHRPLGGGVQYDDVNLSYRPGQGELDVKTRSGRRADYCFMVVAPRAPRTVAGADDWSYDADRRRIVIRKRGANFRLHIDLPEASVG